MEKKKLYILKDGEPVVAKSKLEWALFMENEAPFMVTTINERKVVTYFIGFALPVCTWAETLFCTTVFQGEYEMQSYGSTCLGDAELCHTEQVYHSIGLFNDQGLYPAVVGPK